MHPNYFFRTPTFPMGNNTLGENSMKGMPPEEDIQKQEYTQPEPITGFGTGGPELIIQPPIPVQDDINYTQGYLKTQIGRYVKIEFLIGTNLFIDREGILEEVGISYVVIKEAGTGNPLICDIYSIKFVEIFNGGKENRRP